MSEGKCIYTGGPAFPVIAENGLGHVSYGMTLRDWFAGKAEYIRPHYADAEILVGRKMPDLRSPGEFDRLWESLMFWADVEALVRYSKADAMLVERAKYLGAKREETKG